jgi:CRISPR-associated protein Csb2
LPELPQEQVEPILRVLAEPPEFFLPPASTGHTRHFMPWFKKGPDDRTLVFDAFVALDRGSRLVIAWPTVSLLEEERHILIQILHNLTVFGRSESWCEAELADSLETTNQFICRPLQNDVPPDHDIVRLLCPDPERAFANPIEATGHGKGKQTREKRSTIYDPAWNLCMETLQLHKERWSDPPGSRWVPYLRHRDCFKIESKARSRQIATKRCIQVVRYALDSTVLPLVMETLPVAEAARRALMGIHGRLTERNGVRGRSDLFSGKDAQGLPLTGHRHAYYLPTDEDHDGRLDHLTVYARDGFDLNEQRAFDRFNELRTGRPGETRYPLRLLLLGMGTVEEFGRGPVQASKVWESVTPYVATRYAKTKGRSRVDLRSPDARAAFLIEDLRAQLRAVRPKIAEEVTIETLWDQNQVFSISERWRPIQFKRFRWKRSDDGGRRLAGAFRLIFPVPVRGPLALGHSAHFGLGQFMPAGEQHEM